MGGRVDFALAILNGAIGDYLARTANGLATPMAWVAPRRVIQTRRVVVLIHGLMCTETVWRLADGEDYGSLLARDLGYTPLYVRYNSGLAIPDNGAALAALLDGLDLAAVDEILLLGHSMGGLVARSACHVGGAWLPKVKRAIYVGTPHRGAPLERFGRVATRLLELLVDDPVTRLLADLGNLRSDGVKDLGDADLRHEDRARRTGGLGLRDRRHPVPLLDGIAHHLVAGTVSPDAWLTALFGDSIVPVASATARGDHALPVEHVKLLPGTPHLALAHHAGVYAQVRAWCTP